MLRVKPYNGNSPYIFISYAHKDSEEVLPIVNTLADNGFRVWFDQGIEAGTEWPEYIEERLENASVVLAFMTPAAIRSQNCRNEINLASDLGKEMLVIYLQDTDLRNAKGMRLQLNSRQSLFYKAHKSYDGFIEQLVNARILQGCRPKSAAKPVANHAVEEASDRSQQEEKKITIRPPEPEKMEPKQTITQKIGEFLSAYDRRDKVMAIALVVAVIFAAAYTLVHCHIIGSDILADVVNFELSQGSGFFKKVNGAIFSKIWIEYILYALFIAACFVAGKNCDYEELHTVIGTSHIVLPLMLVLVVDPFIVVGVPESSDVSLLLGAGKIYLTIALVALVRVFLPGMVGFFANLFSIDD